VSREEYGEKDSDRTIEKIDSEGRNENREQILIQLIFREKID